MTEEQHRNTLVFDASDEYRPEPPPPPEIPAWKDGSLRIGIHTSIAGDAARALEIAHGLGANALQIFSGSPRMWGRGAWRISDADAARFRARRKELGLGPLAIHTSYLINLASQNPVLRTQSVQAFHQEIVRAVALGADYLIMHPGCAVETFGGASLTGSSGGVGRDRMAEAAVAIAQGLKQAARGVKRGELRILLENTAGQGSSVGSRFEELKAIIDACPEMGLGVCVDTAHLLAAGWDVRTAEGLERALGDIERTVGLARVNVIHVNDSKAALGSRLDRHEHIGKGKIGLDGFARIVNHAALAGKAFILETPIDRVGDDRRNVAALWKLAGREVVGCGRDGMKPRKKVAKKGGGKGKRKRKG